MPFFMVVSAEQTILDRYGFIFFVAARSLMHARFVLMFYFFGDVACGQFALALQREPVEDTLILP